MMVRTAEVWNPKIILMIKALYNISTSTVLVNNNQGTLFKTTVVVRQDCLLSPVLFNVLNMKLWPK